MSKEVNSESVSLCPLNPAASTEQEMLCIFGTGDLGRSLGQRLLQTGYRVVYGSRRPHSCGPLPPGTQVRCMTIVVFLAVFLTAEITTCESKDGPKPKQITLFKVFM